MKIAITHPYSWPEVRRGAERIVVETADAIAKRGHDVTILTAGSAGSTITDGRVTTVRVRRVFTDRFRHERYFGWRISPYLAMGKFDVVHSMMPWDGLAAIRTRAIGNHRVVYEDMGIPWKWWIDQQPDRLPRIRLIRDADVYGCMSQAALDALGADWGRKGDLIPGGVRLSQFCPVARRAERPTILFSGAFAEPHKGLPELLAAASLLVDKWPQLTIQLSGRGDPEQILANSPSEIHSRVELLPLGAPEDQGNRYARAWVTALPSRGDSFGLVLIESLAAGTPILVYNHAAPPELVRHGNGVISDSLDPEPLSAALSKALQLALDPETVTRCRESVRRFDWEQGITPILEEIYGCG